MSFTTALPKMCHGQIKHECHEFQRYSTNFKSQDLSSDFGRCHSKKNGFQQSVIRYPSSNDVYVKHSCDGCKISRGSHQSTNVGNNPLPFYHPAPFYQIPGSKSAHFIMSSSQSPSFVYSSHGSGISNDSSRTCPKKSCLDCDSGLRTPDQENEELKVVMKMKNQKISELTLKAEKQDWQIYNLKNELLKAKSNVREKSLLREELKKTKDRYKKLLVKFKKLHNKSTARNVIWKRKHKKLDSENKNLKEELHRTIEKLRSTEGFLAIHENNLTGWGCASALEVDKNSEEREIAVDSGEEVRPPGITPESEP